MSRDILRGAREISSEVRSSEDGFDLALASNARLVARLLDVRREAGLPARTGRSALNRALEAMNHGAKARETLLDMHEELASINIRELATGDLLECPDVKGQLALVPSDEDRSVA
jgi:hypothetical protein